MESSVALPNITNEYVSKSLRPEREIPVFKVAGIFSSHMGLQRDEPALIWGFSNAPGTIVTGKFMGEKRECTVNEDGRWHIEFSAHAIEKTPQTMTLSDACGHKAELSDILIGDVWLVGGQSNAELTLKPCLILDKDIAFDENAPIRLFAQNQLYPYQHQETCEYPSCDVICPDWKWKRPDEEASLEFSAMGYYFAKELSESIDIPVGMVMIAAGGACLRELMTPSLAEKLHYGPGNICAAGYYNSLIHPIVPLRFKGMLYFQGESEGCGKSFADAYDKDLKLFVEDERKIFMRDFPFYYVQVSDYLDNCFTFFPWMDIVRVKQFDALSIIPNAAMTVSMDLGSESEHPDWAHSPKKKALSKRLAALALSREYGIGNEFAVTSPMPVSAVKKGNEIEITFKTAYPLVSDINPLPGFSVGGYENRVPAEAEIAGENIIRVKIPENADASHVNYAFSIRAAPEHASVKNQSGLPVPAFSMNVAEEAE